MSLSSASKRHLVILDEGVEKEGEASDKEGHAEDHIMEFKETSGGNVRAPPYWGVPR